jgi:MFS family permease
MTLDLSSLRIRNFRLFYIGQFISIAGTWMANAAMALLVLRLSGSGTQLGIVTGAQFVPMLLLGAWGGVLADRLPKRRTLLVVNTGMGVVAIVLTICTALDVISVPGLIVASVAIGLMLAAEVPARQAFIAEIVGRDKLSNALGLNAAMFNLGRALGPALAAVLIQFFDVWVCFAINTVSFVAVVVGLAMMNTEHLTVHPPAATQRGALRRGLSYAAHHVEIRTVLLSAGIVTLIGANFMVTVPLLATVSFGQDSWLVGAMLAIVSVGGVCAALVSAGRRNFSARFGLWLGVGYSLAWMSVVVWPTWWSALPSLIVAGFLFILFVTNCNATLQLATEQRFRGRVVAIYALILLGTQPFGDPTIGFLADRLSPRIAVAIGGTVSLIGCLVLLRLHARWTGSEKTTGPSPAVDLSSTAGPTESSLADLPKTT